MPRARSRRPSRPPSASSHAGLVIAGVAALLGLVVFLMRDRLFGKSAEPSRAPARVAPPAAAVPPPPLPEPQEPDEPGVVRDALTHADLGADPLARMENPRSLVSKATTPAGTKAFADWVSDHAMATRARADWQRETQAEFPSEMARDRATGRMLSLYLQAAQDAERSRRRYYRESGATPPAPK